MSEAQRIAAKLTEAQRRAIVFSSRTYRADIMAQNITLDALERRGIIGKDSLEYTPLGLEVRKILEAQS